MPEILTNCVSVKNKTTASKNLDLSDALKLIPNSARLLIIFVLAPLVGSNIKLILGSREPKPMISMSEITSCKTTNMRNAAFCLLVRTSQSFSMLVDIVIGMKYDFP